MDRLVTPAASEPLTLAQAKAELEVIHTSDDDKIAAKVKEARDYCETFIGQKLATQTWDMVLDCFPDGINLTHKPVQSVESIKYLDADGVLQTLAPSEYFVDTFSGWISGTWPATRAVINSVQIRYVCGYAEAALVPESIMAAMKYKLRLLYDQFQASDATYMDLAVKNLLDPYRVNMGV